jgi:hypothetical protein
MVARNKSRISQVQQLESKRLLSKVKKASNMAEKALKHYGEPTISLSELRNQTSQQLQGVSLTDVILKDREAGW